MIELEITMTAESEAGVEVEDQTVDPLTDGLVTHQVLFRDNEVTFNLSNT